MNKSIFLLCSSKASGETDAQSNAHTAAISKKSSTRLHWRQTRANVQVGQPVPQQPIAAIDAAKVRHHSTTQCKHLYGLRMRRSHDSFAHAQR